MRFRLWSFCFLLLLALSASAQKRKAVVRKPVLTPEQQAYQAKLERMTQNTERVMFIDSLVVDKADFLSHYHLSPEVGHVERYADFFKSAQQPNAFIHRNETGDKCYLAQESTDSTMNLYETEIVENRWTRPTPLRGINDDGAFRRVNYPFLMGDGQTLYFSAEGDDGLGGYDIYVTRYNEAAEQFFHPTNIGMPFNSEANDYMYVIDEYANLGWFATDRNQQPDKVCIYTFIPSSVRQTYSPDVYTAEQLSRFARLESIADTWTDSLALQQARERLSEVSKPQDHHPDAASFRFVVNDETVYTELADFRATGNTLRYQQAVQLSARRKSLQEALSRAREYYATASPDERAELKPEIIASEAKLYELEQEIHALEKEIRHQEIQHHANNK